MANLTVFSVKNLNREDFKIFAGLYNDFKNRAKTDYKFDLDPLSYEDFITAVRNGLLKCLILFENSIPTGFLIYTTLISYSIELNIIYLIETENYETKIRYLLNQFIEDERDLLTHKIVTYPILGEQEKYKNVLSEFDFKNVTQSVLKFDFTNPTCITKINSAKDLHISEEYRISNWQDAYKNDVINLIFNNFKDTNDALFDPRFKDYNGTSDIINKIVNSNYGEFLPQFTKILLKDNQVIGACLVNVTGTELVNIPLVAIDHNFRGQKLGEKIVSEATKEIFENTLNKKLQYTEINVTTDLSNISAVRMYRACGFFEDYNYTQSYRNPIN